MMRGVLYCLGLALAAVGLIVTFATWTVDGHTVLAAIGAALVAAVWVRAEREARREEVPS